MNSKSLTIIAATTFLAGASVTLAQDIEFMGKNGDKIELTPEVEIIPSHAVDVVPQASSNAVPQARNRMLPMLGGFSDLAGRTFTVEGPDGKPKEISIDNARSVSINRSFSSSTDNGQRQIRQGGTATIVDSDGERYEIDLGELQPDETGKGLQGKRGETKPAKRKKSYMLGVFSEPVPEMMRSQLNLDKGIGLMVKAVQAGSPAALAGIKKFDILLFADDQALSVAQDLTGIVSESGDRQQPFTLTVMRGGEEISVEVTSAEREIAAGIMPGLMPQHGFEMHDMGPGLIFDDEFDNEMIERMKNHLQEVREQMKRMDGLLQERNLPLRFERR